MSELDFIDTAIDTEISFDPEVIDMMPDRPLIEMQDVNGNMTMRPYQVECVDACFESWRDYDALMVVLATGMGKTVCAADIINRWPVQCGRILFIAHMQELIFQAQDKIGLHTEERPSIEMGIHRESTDGHDLLDRSKCLVASIQTMNKRMQKFDPKNFGLVIIDEFHHAGAATYRRLWDYFKTGNPHIKMLGITATPYRGDNISLGCLAEHCPFEMGIREGIDEGWLVPIEQTYIVVEHLDFSACRTVAKDLNEGDLEEVVMGGKVQDGMTDEERLAILEKQERMLHAMAAPTVEEAQGRTTLFFCVTVAHAERMAEVLRRYPGVTAEVLVGTTPADERADRIARFKNGALQILVVVGCATEGFDAPNVEVVAMGRMTKKQGLYVQMVGRGTRPQPGVVDRYCTADERKEAIGNSRKPRMLVLDFVGNSGKHKLISTADVLAGDMPPDLVEAAIQDMKETGESDDIRNAVWKQKQKRDEEAKRAAEIEKARREAAIAAEEARRVKLRAEAEYRSKQVDPFSHQQVPEQVQSKFRGGATDAQVKKLVSLGIPEGTAMGWTKTQAGAVIGERMAKHGGDWFMPFGKYKGKQLRQIPHEYLRWAGENIHSTDFQENLNRFRQEFKKQAVQ